MRAQLFHTCLVNEVDPEVGLAVVRVLERLGVEVQVPRDQTCCGQPAYNAGFHDQARDIARHTVRVLSGTDGPIVVPSGSCADMIVHQYGQLFRDDAGMVAEARRVADRCIEFSQFVAARISAMPAARLSPTRIAYHPSCHLLRGLGERHAPHVVLSAIDGASCVDVADAEECCGFGGLFSIKNADISASMLGRKLDAIDASRADRVVSCDLGCLLHIGGGLHRRGSTVRVQHLAQIVDEAQT